MKKAIIALLTTILATFGYAVVDKTVDTRLSNLEYKVSSQQDLIESLHRIGKFFSETITSSAESETETTGMDVHSSLGYKYSSDGYYYCDDKDNWQKDIGYNEVYDQLAPYAAMYIDQVRIRFEYGGKNWMIQFWKGQYGYLLIGAEIGVYTCDLNQYNGGTGDINHFNAADKEDWLKMQLDCYYCKGGNGTYKKVFTRPYDTYWWATGFVKGQLTKYTAPRTELKTKNRITFKSPEQANLFVQGLKLGGFRRAAGADQLVDDSYFMSGSDVWVLWSTIYQDSFVGYEGRDEESYSVTSSDVSSSSLN